MQLPDDPTLLQTVLATSPLSEVERTWAFLVFCGLVEPASHDEFIRLAAEHTDPLQLADALLDLATRRAELLDKREALAQRLWQYFQVGQSLEPEREEGTQPGITGVDG
ncbi:MAG: hypothetical protein ACO1OB_03370 [Archangium sp.]